MRTEVLPAQVPVVVYLARYMLPSRPSFAVLAVTHIKVACLTGA